MLALVATLCLVLLAIQWAANPAHWRWFTELGDGQNAQSVEGEKPPPALDEIEFHALHDDREPLPPGVFRAEFEPETESSGVELPDGFDPTALPSGLLADAPDNQLNLLRAEQPVLTFVIDRARQLDQQDIDAAAIDNVAFTVLMTRPDDYRGRILRLKGTLRQLQPYTGPGSDAFGEGVYQGWMFTATSDNNPYCLLLTELPPDVPTGTDMEIPVEFTGYFYRLYGYLTRGGDHVAPLLIGKSLQPRPLPAAPDNHIGEDLSRIVLFFLLGLVLVLGLLLWWFMVSDRRFRSSRMQQLAEARLDARDEDLSALADVDIVDPERMFEDLE